MNVRPSAFQNAAEVVLGSDVGVGKGGGVGRGTGGERRQELSTRANKQRTLNIHDIGKPSASASRLFHSR